MPGWTEDNLAQAWDAFLQSCSALKNQLVWQPVCLTAEFFEHKDNQHLRLFFELNFTPYQVLNADGSDEGMVTGYYEPLLFGSRTLSSRYRYPIYSVPDDLLAVDMGDVYPDLKNLRLRGRIVGKKVVPYYSRAEIEQGAPTLIGRELLWVDNPVELFFLQIQGSGRVKLDTGETIRIGYAEQNGYPYKSIGRLLVERGELPLDKASMQGIKNWGFQNPQKLAALLNENPSYVFFRELPSNLPGPIGAFGVPLTAGRSLAIDPRVIPQGAPVYISTTWPNSSNPLNRLMLAQDRGGAINGGVRADFFWGFGEEAANQAGKMKQSGKMWVLLPKDYAPQPN
jgi:peptidoglycan lytic transglycosylase A